MRQGQERHQDHAGDEAADVGPECHALGFHAVQAEDAGDEVLQDEPDAQPGQGRDVDDENEADEDQRAALLPREMSRRNRRAPRRRLR